VPTTDTPGRKALRHAMKRAAQVYAPPPTLTLSEWADEYRYLSPEDSAAAGRWSTDSAPYQKEPMDACSDPLVEDVVMMWNAQSGKTQILLNIKGYYIHQDPAPILELQPTLDMAQSVSKDRFAPMLRDTPVLRGKVRDARARDSGNTVLHKTFPGGHVTFAGANSPASLASRPIRVLLCDEIDRYPASAGTEGDPVNLARKRTTTFWNRKRIYTSTPTLKGVSRIESLYELSDRRRYYVPCPQCGELQALMFGNLKWEKDKPETAYYVCLNGCPIQHNEKMEMLRAGEWRAENPESLMRGYWINEVYSPWVTWGEMAHNWLEAKHGGLETLKTFVNTSLAETWQIEGESVNDVGLLNRLEDYPAEVPEGAVVLTAGIDVQRDRIEMEVVAWGLNEQSWSVDYLIFRGEVDAEKRAQAEKDGTPVLNPWEELDIALRRRFRHACGVDLGIIAAMIDSGDGVTTHQVYKFVGPRKGRSIWAAKGVAGTGKPIVNAHPSTQRNGALLWMVGVDTAKEQIYSNLKLEVFGAGYCHFPRKEQYDAEHFKQLTAERVVVKKRNGIPYRCWERTRARNEALDCRVYAMAALEARRVDWERAAESLQKQAEQKAAVPEPEKIIAGSSLPPAASAPKPSRQIMRNSWVNRW
jgi:phage terminase large subunit GpA-like protein